MNTREYLQYLLSTNEWTAEDKKWMQQYLAENELSDLETVALESFNNDEDGTGQLPGKKVAAAVLDRIHQQMAVVPQPRAGLFRRYRRSIAVAASVLVIAGVGYFFRESIAGPSQVVPMQEIVSGAKERKQVVLPDSSLVYLEPGSSIRFPATFAGDTRLVSLEGEAFFEVTKDKAHPFVIHTATLNTTVLGTSFTIEAYPSRQARVVVVSGTVKVEAPQAAGKTHEVVITASQSAVLNDSTQQLEQKEAVADALFVEQRRLGKFVYNGVPVQNVLQDMARFFQAEVHCTDAIKSCSFFGSFYTSDDLEKALSLVAATLNASIKKDQATGRYSIVGGTCH